MTLSQGDKIDILIMNAKGLDQYTIAKRLKCSQSTVSRVISKYREHRTIDILPGRGRKRITSSRTNRRIKFQTVRSKDMSTRDVKATLSDTGINISCAAIKDRLHSEGLHGRIKRKVPMISKRNRIK